MPTKNDSAETLSVIVTRVNGRADAAAFTQAAVEAIAKLSSDEDAQASAVETVVDEILADEKYSTQTRFTTNTLGRMAVNAMGKMLDDKNCDEAAKACGRILAGRPEEFLHISNGRNAGFHYRARLTVEELAKLTKEKSAK